MLGFGLGLNTDGANDEWTPMEFQVAAVDGEATPSLGHPPALNPPDGERRSCPPACCVDLLPERMSGRSFGTSLLDQTDDQPCGFYVLDRTDEQPCGSPQLDPTDIQACDLYMLDHYVSEASGRFQHSTFTQNSKLADCGPCCSSGLRDDGNEDGEEGGGDAKYGRGCEAGSTGDIARAWSTAGGALHKRLGGRRWLGLSVDGMDDEWDDSPSETAPDSPSLPRTASQSAPPRNPPTPPSLTPSQPHYPHPPHPTNSPSFYSYTEPGSIFE